MDLSLKDYHNRIRIINRFTENYIEILSTFYEKKTSSFFRHDRRSIKSKRQRVWEANKNDYECYLGNGASEREIKDSVINITSSTSCYLSLKSKFTDNQLLQSDLLKFDKEKLKNIILKSPWTSTGLKDYNFYTISLLLPALHELGATYDEERIKKAINLIRNELIGTVKCGVGKLGL